MKNPFDVIFSDLPKVRLIHNQEEIVEFARKNVENTLADVRDPDEYRKALTDEIDLARVGGHLKILMPIIDLFFRLKDVIPLQILSGHGMSSLLLHELGMHPFVPTQHGFLRDLYFSNDLVRIPHTTLHFAQGDEFRIIEELQKIIPRNNLIWVAEPGGYGNDDILDFIITNVPLKKLPHKNFIEPETGLRGICIPKAELKLNHHGFIRLTLRKNMALDLAKSLKVREEIEFLGTAAAFHRVIWDSSSADEHPEFEKYHPYKYHLDDELEYVEDWVALFSQEAYCSLAKAYLYLLSIQRGIDSLADTMRGEFLQEGMKMEMLNALHSRIGFLKSREQAIAEHFSEEWKAILLKTESLTGQRYHFLRSPAEQD